MKICQKCNAQFIGKSWNCPNCGYTPHLMANYISFAPELSAANEGFESRFFPELASLEAKNFWFRSRNNLLVYVLKKYFPHAQTFLEIGCGTGFVLQRIEKEFPSLTLYGSEIFLAGLDVASHRLSKSTLFQMDACQIPFSEEFDVIGAFDVLEHIEKDQVALAQIYQATKTGGGIILTVPQHPWLWSPSDDYAHHFRRYSANELKRKVKDTGFTILGATSFISLLLPLMIASRWRSKENNFQYDPLSEFKLNRGVNNILEKILSIERNFIELGFSLPLGGSLLLVARKI